jgi:hypothetical protein
MISVIFTRQIRALIWDQLVEIADMYVRIAEAGIAQATKRCANLLEGSSLMKWQKAKLRIYLKIAQ